MRNLASFEPSEDLIQKINEEEGLKLPPSGLHVTIWGFNIWREDQEKVIESLDSLETEPFTVEITGYDHYGIPPNSYVLTLSIPEELTDLHKKVIRAVRSFDKRRDKFNEMVRRYGNRNYHPHLTISRTKRVPELKHDYVGITMRVTSYQLLKKDGRIWMPVYNFDL